MLFFYGPILPKTFFFAPILCLAITTVKLFFPLLGGPVFTAFFRVPVFDCGGYTV